MSKFQITLIAIPTTALVIYLGIILPKSPRLDRNWAKDLQVLATSSIDGDFVTIQNVRNFDYRSPTDFTPGYYDAQYNLGEIESVWFLVEPFSSFDGPAHTLVSFGFKGDTYVSISVEIRREEGESFSPLRGLLRNYELVYVIGDERDLIRLRSNYRKDRVYLYPIQTTKEKKRELFLSMLKRGNKLLKEPEFYNTISSTCMTNIIRHIHELVPGRVPLSYKVLLPAFADELAYDLGLIDTNLSFEEAKLHFQINEKAMAADQDPNFSIRIREGLIKN